MILYLPSPMTNPSPKDRVLAFVRSKNPSTMEPKELCRYEWSNLDGAAGGGFIQSAKHWDAIQSHPKIDEVKILGSDMTLQELLIAVRAIGMFLIDVHGSIGRYGMGELTKYDLTKNLHEQSDETYDALAKLINE